MNFLIFQKCMFPIFYVAILLILKKKTYVNYNISKDSKNRT